MPNMALNGPGVYHRTREHEQEDASNITKNILAQSWKSWPNEAAVSHSLSFSTPKLTFPVRSS